MGMKEIAEQQLAEERAKATQDQYGHQLYQANKEAQRQKRKDNLQALCQAGKVRLTPELTEFLKTCEVDKVACEFNKVAWRIDLSEEQQSLVREFVLAVPVSSWEASVRRYNNVCHIGDDTEFVRDLLRESGLWPLTGYNPFGFDEEKHTAERNSKQRQLNALFFFEKSDIRRLQQEIASLDDKYRRITEYETKVQEICALLPRSGTQQFVREPYSYEFNYQADGCVFIYQDGALFSPSGSGFDDYIKNPARFRKYLTAWLKELIKKQ